MLKVGIIGKGTMGENHVQIYSEQGGAIELNRKPVVTGEDGVRGIKIAEAAFNSTIK